jgi:hypothetical protein
MNLRLRVSKHDFSLAGRVLRFAVVDLDKSEGYPGTFVCMLPCRSRFENKPDSVFQRVFGDGSLEQAKTLLVGALETEDDAEVKAEIERRLKTFEPKQTVNVACDGCGKLFHRRRARYVRRNWRNFCPECMKKKYGS